MLPYNHVDGHLSECHHQQDLPLLKTILAYSRLLSPGRDHEPLTRLVSWF